MASFTVRTDVYYLFYMDGFWKIPKTVWLEICRSGALEEGFAIDSEYALQRAPNWLRKNKGNAYSSYREVDDLKHTHNYFEPSRWTKEDFEKELKILKEEDEKETA